MSQGSLNPSTRGPRSLSLTYSDEGESEEDAQTSGSRVDSSVSGDNASEVEGLFRDEDDNVSSEQSKSPLFAELTHFYQAAGLAPGATSE